MYQTKKFHPRNNWLVVELGFLGRRDLLTLQSKVPFSLKVAFLVSDFVKLCIANKVIGFLEMSELEFAS